MFINSLSYFCFGASFSFSFALSWAEEGAPGTEMPSLMFELLNDDLASRLSASNFGALTSPLNSVLPFTVLSPKNSAFEPYTAMLPPSSCTMALPPSC